MPAAELKGFMFNRLLQSVRNTHGSVGLARLKEQVSPDLAEPLFSNLILTTSWYSANKYTDLLRAMRLVFGEGRGTYLWDVAHEAMAEDVRGPYRHLILAAKKLLSTDSMVKLVPRLSQFYQRGGGMSISADGDRALAIEYRNWDGFNSDAWAAAAGAHEAGFTACGAKDVKCELRVKAAHSADIHVRWD